MCYPAYSSTLSEYAEEMKFSQSMAVYNYKHIVEDDIRSRKEAKQWIEYLQWLYVENGHQICEIGREDEIQQEDRRDVYKRQVYNTAAEILYNLFKTLLS